MAYRQGAEGYEAAKEAWLKLLQRPAAERHYRTVWAAFMLGKLALKQQQAEASEWFQKTRAFAAAGFADSLGMAADSYGWEGRSEWKQGHPEKAAVLFLTQLSLGDESAVESLKALIPDRPFIWGMLNYGPTDEERDSWTEEQKQEQAKEELVGLRRAARDPLLRRLVTAHVLARATGYAAEWNEENAAGTESRLARWLRLLKEAGVKQTEDAEYLGYAAYQQGDYASAERWLRLAPANRPIALWLEAKLLRRAGKLTQAAQKMVQAWQSLTTPTQYTGWTPAPSDPSTAAAPNEPDENEIGENEAVRQPLSPGGWAFTQHAGGDAGGLLLARGEFVEALNAFRQADLWEDAAYVAESILTVDELKAYVDREHPTARPAPPESTPSAGDKLAYLLGRRLVRQHRYSEAIAYLPAPYPEILKRFVQAKAEGADTHRSKEERAAAWFRAAWIARVDGMELMGTEVAPDAFLNGGNFELESIAKQRRTGQVPPIPDYRTDKPGVITPLVLLASKEEVQRLKQHQVSPEVRYHYRAIAAGLALNAAALLPDNSPELADVVNRSGYWLIREDKLADRHYAILRKRCAKTEIGKAALAAGRCIDERGLWSERETAAHEAMMKELQPAESAEAEPVQ